MTFRLVTETATSASAFYHETDVADIVLQTRPRPSANCHATGDPHYRTFDGHPYHIRPAGKAVFYKSSDPDRFFEVQTDMYVFNGRPAVQCGVAVRENNDIVVINLCRTGSQIDMRRTCGSGTCRLHNGFPKLGITSSGLPRYTIDFASGAQVRIDVGYWSAIARRYMNVYVTAPGVDSKRTSGLCGNNDGIASNDVNVAHNAWIENLNSLSASQRVTASNDLFGWYPAAGSIVAVPTLPPFAEECNYTLAPYVRPILNQPNVEVRGRGCLRSCRSCKAVVYACYLGTRTVDSVNAFRTLLTSSKAPSPMRWMLLKAWRLPWTTMPPFPSRCLSLRRVPSASR
jgi:hypothetical protein